MLRIVEFRKEKGLTQTALAEKLDISVKKLGAWEQGRAEPCIEDLCMIANFFDCTLDELIGRVIVDKYTTGNGMTPQENILLTEFRKLGEKERQQSINVIIALQLEY